MLLTPVAELAFQSSWKSKRILYLILMSLYSLMAIPLFIVVCAFFAVTVSPIVRVIATLNTIIRHPLLSIESIPTNWWRIVACVDTLHAPEPLPGFLVRRNEPSIQGFLRDENIEFYRELFDLTKMRESIPNLFNVILIFPSVYIPALVYRWSLKGTSIIYGPLVWVIRGTFAPTTWHVLREVKQLFSISYCGVYH